MPPTFLRGLRERLLADPSFLIKLGIEVSLIALIDGVGDELYLSWIHGITR